MADNYTQADLAAIQKAKAQGLRSVVLEDGRQLQFRSLAELNAIEREIKKSLAPETAYQRPGYVLRTTKGY